MRAVVVSDSHGDVNSLIAAVKRQFSTDMVIFLGDGERDIYDSEFSALLKNKMLVAVRGNCDLYSQLPEEEIVSLGGKKIYCLHGHTKGVKHGFETLEHEAELKKADVVVHGHTHETRVNFINGIWYMCPGSVKTGWYGVIDVEEKTGGVFCYLQNLYFEVDR